MMNDEWERGDLTKAKDVWLVPLYLVVGTFWEVRGTRAISLF